MSQYHINIKQQISLIKINKYYDETDCKVNNVDCTLVNLTICWSLSEMQINSVEAVVQ